MAYQEMLYDHSSILITAVLFVLIMLFNEVGFRIGRFVQDRTDKEVKTLTGSLQASVLGLLALLLGFSFSMAMQRYDSRSQAVIDEANAIGTAMLRIELLPEKYQQQVATSFEKYLDLRVAIATIDLTEREKRDAYNKQTSDVQRQLWSLAVSAADEDPRPVTTGAFINSLNGAIDSQGKRNALLQMHVPEPVLLLLFIVFISSGGILGYSTGLSGKRIVAPTAFVSFLIAMIVFIIIDLDRPKRGLIQVNQAVMFELKESTARP